MLIRFTRDLQMSFFFFFIKREGLYLEGISFRESIISLLRVKTFDLE